MKRGKRSQRKKSTAKHSLNLPDLDQAKSAVLNSLPSKEPQRGYRHAIDEFISWYCSEPRLSFNKAVVTRYRIHLESRQLAPGPINGRLAAVRRLAYEAADTGLLSPDLAAGIRRVKGPKNLGVRFGNWLTADQARALWQVPDPNTLKGKRDRSIARDPPGLRVAPQRGGGTGCCPSPTPPKSLGCREGRTYPDGASSGLGQERHRFVACVRWCERRPRVSVRLPCRQDLGKRRNGAGRVARCKGLRQKSSH
jgi:hypothetical protein